MSFIHDDPEFGELLRIVAAKRKLSVGLIEKDYWVTHTLWAIQAAGFDLWFKGGTSLSKGFSLIERFSEDLDLKVEPGSVTAWPAISNWKSEGTKAVRERKACFQKLPTHLLVPGARTSLDPDLPDNVWRNANMRVTYPGRNLNDLKAGGLKPFVLLEIGNARVTPFVPRDLSSFVHDELEAQGQLGSFAQNLPRALRCVHPLVTLLEKLDALHRRAPNAKAEPAVFVRHFEDAAKVIAAETSLPMLPSYSEVGALAADMLGQHQIAGLPSSRDPAFALAPGVRTDALRAAHAAMAPMYWGPRLSLEASCESIRAWLKKRFGP